MTGYLVAKEMLEAVQVGGEAVGQPVAEFGWDRGVIGPGWPGREEPGQPGTLVGSPSRVELQRAPW